MGTLIYNFFNNYNMVIFHRIFNFALFIIFCIYFFSKEGRDERGRKIIGTASFYASISLIVTLNIVGFFSNTVRSNIVIFTNSICLVFIIFELVELIAILILRKSKKM